MRVKVEVDLLRELPKRNNIRIKNKNKEILSKWVQIKYDYLPKYYRTYKLQGHNVDNCFELHPELLMRARRRIKMMKTKDYK